MELTALPDRQKPEAGASGCLVQADAASPGFQLARMFEAVDLQMVVPRQGEQDGEFALPAPVGFEKPVKERILRPQFEMPPEGLAIAVP